MKSFVFVFAPKRYCTYLYIKNEKMAMAFPKWDRLAWTAGLGPWLGRLAVAGSLAVVPHHLLWPAVDPWFLFVNEGRRTTKAGDCLN